MAEIIRVLCPSGVAYIRQGGKWTKNTKPVPDDIGQWNHYLNGPDNNAVAADRRVGPPCRLQWKSDPIWCRSHNGVSSSIALVLSAGGRLFSIIDEGLDQGVRRRQARMLEIRDCGPAHRDHAPGEHRHSLRPADRM